MHRRLERAAWLVALGLFAVSARAAEEPATLDELVRRAVARQPGGGAADEIAAPSSPALAGPIDPATYRLGPGDLLLVLWSGRVSRTDRVEVGPAGDLFLTEVGTLQVAGQTLADARLAILERMRRVTRDVRVEVQLARPRRFRVYLSGSVTRPGPIEALGGARVSDVVRPDELLPGASRRNIRVQRRDGTAELADLERVFRLGDHSRDTWLADGDAVVVPVATEFVRVAGAVPSPGRFERRADDSLGTVLRMAGGLRPETAPELAQWVHWSGSAQPETLAFDVREALAGRFGGTPAHGDGVFVRGLPGHRAMGEVVLAGDVARPGGYPVSAAGTRLSEVLAAAGGLLPSADSTGILVLRSPPVPPVDAAEFQRRSRAVQQELSLTEFEADRALAASHADVVRIDWTSRRGSPRTQDPLLEDGDVVRVERLVRSLRIDGQVARPGLLTWEPGLTVRDYVRQAGGGTARAWRGHEQVTRAGTAHTLLAKSAGELRPGDFIWVPMRPEDSVWRRAGALLGGLAQIATIVIAIRSVR
jgi:protein involved in polysaccharide export with SLBB domain